MFCSCSEDACDGHEPRNVKMTRAVFLFNPSRILPRGRSFCGNRLLLSCCLVADVEVSGRSLNPCSYSWKGNLYCVPSCGGVVPTRDPDAYPHAAWFPLSGVRSTTRAVVEGNGVSLGAAPRLSYHSGGDTVAAVPSPCPTITSGGSRSCFGDAAAGNPGAGNPGASGAAGASTADPTRDSCGEWSTIAYDQRGYSNGG